MAPAICLGTWKAKPDTFLDGRSLAQEAGQFIAQTLSRAVEAGFHTSFRAADDGADLAVGKLFVVVEKQRGLKIVRQAINRLTDRSKCFTLLQRSIGGGAFRRDGFVGRYRCVIDGCVKADGWVAAAPAIVVVAEIGKRGKQPGGQSGVQPQSVPLLVQPDKRLGDQIIRVGLILNVTPREREQGALPPADQFVQRAVAPFPQR